MTWLLYGKDPNNINSFQAPVSIVSIIYIDAVEPFNVLSFIQLWMSDDLMECILCFAPHTHHIIAKEAQFYTDIYFGTHLLESP